MNQVLDVIKKRSSTRAYKEDSVPSDILQTIVEAGRMAPTGHNNQTTRFYVISNLAILEQLKKIVMAEFAAMENDENLYSSFKRSITASKAGNYDFMYDAPVLIVLTNDNDYGNAMADCVMANAQMTLAATSLDIGSCYINQLHWLEKSVAIRELLGISADETICCSLALGYPKKPLDNKKKITGNPVIKIK